ncbi:hypothetical protein [Streptomyces ortus]|uniref:Uncharacterized protein n=1 Tax=Streptomyces ortus TaxID=2867268 RepID=A0ABT3UZ48_9ACTN|nr:hypothetical protein [Streptomyces ortus]MCX4232883.1 hypothetical protein [Streptomyces ortus]
MGPHIRHIRHVGNTRHPRPALVAALTSTLLAPVAAVSATAASPRFPTGVTLRGSRRADATTHRFLPDDPDDLDGPADPAPCHAPDLHVAQSSGHGHGTRAVAVRDDLGSVCELADERQYDSTRIAKVLIMERLLRRADKLRIRTRAHGLSGESDRPAPYEPLPGRDEPQPGATP